MFYREASNQYINEGMQFEIDEITYPANWLNQSTPEQKSELGLVEVTVEGELKDQKYYWTGETLSGSVKTLTATPKDLDQVKEFSISEIKQTAFLILQPTDYIEPRNMRDANYKVDWMLWRDSIRARSSYYVNAIKLMTSVDQIAALKIEWPNDPSYIDPVEN